MSLIYILFLNILFFSKDRVKNKETRIYSYLIISNLVGLILELLSGYAIELIPSYSILVNLLLKSFLIYLAFFATVLTFYVINISMFNGNFNVDKYNKVYKAIKLIIAINIVVLLVLPISYYSKDGIIYSYGLSATYSFIYGGLCAFVSIIIVLIKYE